MPATTILLADDHPLFRQGLAALLREQGEGWQIVGEASDGLEAVRLAESLQPDILVLDVEMPGLNGIEAAARIRQASPATLIIAVSMYGDEYYRRRMFEAGASAYVVKSEAIGDLVKAVHASRKGERFQSPSVAKDEKVEADSHANRSAEIDKYHLTPRELEVLGRLAQGQRNKEIAAALGISVKTVETYRSRIGIKLGIDNLQGLVLFAIRTGLIPVGTRL